MAITNYKQIPFSNLDAVAGIEPEIARAADKNLRFNGQPCEVFVINNGTGAQVDYNAQTTLGSVLGGFVYDVTNDALKTFPVTPLGTDAGVGVITGSLLANTVYLLFVFGVK